LPAPKAIAPAPRLLVYGLNFWPELTGVGKYTGEMCQWFAERGHTVEAVTAPPYYPAWQVSEGYRRFAYQTETWGAQKNLHVLRCPLWVPRQPRTSSRLLHLASFALSSIPALWAALRRRPDLMMVIVPTLFVAPAALALARAYGVRTWVHVQDFEVDAMFGLGMGGGQGRARQLVYAVESLLLRQFDFASSITPAMVERLVAKGVKRDRCVLFPNWVDLAAVFPTTGANAFRADLGLGDDDVAVLYAGNMGEKQGLDLVIEVAQALRARPHIRFVLAGDGAARVRLRQASAGLPNVQWLPLQPMERLNELLNCADIHVLPQRADAADLVMPSKLTGMLASGRAIVGTAAVGTQLGGVLDLVGRRTAPGDVAALAAAIESLAADPASRLALGRAGRSYAEEQLAVDHVMQQLLARILNITGRPAGKSK